MDNSKWTLGIRANFAEFVRDLKNTDDVAEYLHSQTTPELIRYDELDTISRYPLEQKKVRKLMELLEGRGGNAVVELYNAFVQTKNPHLAERMKMYVQQYERANVNIPEKMNPEWPPSLEELEKMDKDPVRKCNIKSPSLVEPYSNKYVYKMKSRIRGRAIIINNEEFINTKLNRDGSFRDRNGLKIVLEQLHFKVRVENNLTAEKIERLVEEESKHPDHAVADCFIFVVLSHGNRNGILGIDEKDVPISKLTDPFDSSNCPSLEGKPRVFIFQACRGKQEQETSVVGGDGARSDDAEDIEDVSGAIDEVQSEARGTNPKIQVGSKKFSKSDFIYAYATAAGFKAYRSTRRGSWFIQALIWLLKYKSHEEHLADILTQVNKLVSMGKADRVRTVSNYETSLTQKLYFFPGVWDDPPKINQ